MAPASSLRSEKHAMADKQKRIEVIDALKKQDY
jgi:hypothetical protein